METDPDVIISSENYDKFDIGDIRRSHIEWVQDLMRQGLMTQSALYERFTASLSKTLVRFVSIIQSKTPQPGQEIAASVGLSAMFDILTWHAAFPFAPTRNSMDENGFLRAICLLTWNPPPHYAPTFSSRPVHGLYTGNWGPHSGWLVATRGKGPQDFRRRLFRSLAEPGAERHGQEPAGTVSTAPITIPVPRFVRYQPRELDSGETDENDLLEVAVVAHEDERSVDLLDVLSENPAEDIPMTCNPLRECYEPVLATLPRQPHQLTELRIPTAKLVSFLRLLHASERQRRQRDGGDAAGSHLMALAQGLGDRPPYISWHRFDAVIAPHTERIGRILSDVFSTFKAPLRPSDE
ncbi:hypothetical protein N656DRAFT_707096 [Canariomyces notabilis]|uniref:Uncharacterized protein n=1 Tax=Canariomyces notabilis TaxID=2074819 RepID=A0AAN6TH64_9PEZI|nr:hypothetical protein N656DRAFT_707096 [Canariomyces arenarius]